MDNNPPRAVTLEEFLAYILHGKAPSSPATVNGATPACTCPNCQRPVNADTAFNAKITAAYEQMLNYMAKADPSAPWHGGGTIDPKNIGENNRINRNATPLWSLLYGMVSQAALNNAYAALATTAPVLANYLRTCVLIAEGTMSNRLANLTTKQTLKLFREAIADTIVMMDEEPALPPNEPARAMYAKFLTLTDAVLSK